MEAIQSPMKVARPPGRSRKSIAHMPTLTVNNEKENVTVNLAAPSNSMALGNITAKKPRSKSIGPGGLDALKEDAGNRRQSAVTPFVKSILKPTVPVSPRRRNSPLTKPRNLSPKKSTPESKSMLNSSGESSGSISMQPGPISPSQYRTRIVVRSEEEQQAAAKERERHELLAHKEARRKSLANRRVSFAPEATLHTWDVVELPEDSTVSSASTNLTRRASALSAVAASPFPQPSPMPNLDASEPPSTPPAQVEETQVAASPSHQRDLHQKKHRRSSGIPPMNFNNPDELSSSPCSRASVNDNEDETQMLTTAEECNDHSNSDDNDSIESESTMTGIDLGDLSAHSHEDSSTGSSLRLEEALRLAAMQAGTQGIEYDENGDISMELADDEITSAFQPWMKESTRTPQIRAASTALKGEENVNPFSPAFGASATEATVADEAENTMEFTQSVGTILTNINQRQSLSVDHPELAGVLVNRSNAEGHRRSSGDSSVLGDETMDLTIAVGAIHQNQQELSLLQPVEGSESGDEDEELTMDFTSAVGGLLGQLGITRDGNSVPNEKHISGGQLLNAKNSTYNQGLLHTETGTTPMAADSLSSITEHTEPPEDQTVDMDITTAIGAILSQRPSASNTSHPKLSMETQSENRHPISSPFSGSLPSNSRPSNHVAVITSETGSPSLMPSQKKTNATKISSQRQSTTPKSASRQFGPAMKLSTPSKQHPPKISSPTTPTKSPPSRNVFKKSVSPGKKVKAEAQHKSPAPQKVQATQLFTKDSQSGEATPVIVLKPPLRRSSGVGVDKPGLGSPRVTALLDRRQSIGENAETFSLQKEASKRVAFEEAQTVKDELERQYILNERSFPEQAALKEGVNTQAFGEEEEPTANLKDLIESLTPRKKKINGRKSLHVGAAKGLLGKRPVELDENDEDDLTPKRLKGREGSPVKKVRLPAPPTKSQTTGRITRSARRSLEETAGNINISTPTQVGRTAVSKAQKNEEGIKDVEKLLGVEKMPHAFQDKVEPQHPDAVKSKANVDRVHLQDFLNMTSIRFMELTTTKRRLTVAPNAISENMTDSVAGLEGTAVLERRGSKLEQCVVAGACTIPMLELYQHSCRELKKYIAEGRSIVREIEADTYEENPPLFYEYIEASPETKFIMDNQFKNVKTHARLLSKAMWYEWRMKLLDGLKEGLAKISHEMDRDENSLLKQQKILEPILPKLVHQHDQLEAENQVLQARADELANEDQEELKDTRLELVQIEKEIEAERRIVDELQDEFRRQEERIEYVVDRRQHCLEQIERAEKVRLEGRGWSPSEIASLQARVSDLQKAHEWTITSADGTCLTMTYKRMLQLYFMPASFMRNKAMAPSASNIDNSPISLLYLGDTADYRQPLSTEKRFFLQIIRAHLQWMPQAKTKIQDLLKFISSTWETACLISEEIRILRVSYITEATILRDEVMAIKAVLLLRDMKTKVHVEFEVKVKSNEKAIDLALTIQPSAKVIYGEELKEKKMAEFLHQQIGGMDRLESGTGVGGWARAVLELQERLVARGRK